MKNLKKVIATMAVAAILTTGTVSVASAGGLGDLFSSVASTVVNGVKTVGNAVVGAGKYVFTDADGEESFADMKESAGKTADSAVDVGKSVIKTGMDIQNFQQGMVEMTVGGVATAATAIVETAANAVTGSDSYNWTKSTAGIMKDGYDRYDSAYDTAVDIASMAGPIGTAAANGCKVLKTAGEAAVGYKDRTWSDVGDVAKDAAINTAISVVSCGLGTVAGKAASESAAGIVETVVSSATETAANIAVDLTDPNNDRGVVDTILEDVVNGAIGAGAGEGLDACVTK